MRKSDKIKNIKKVNLLTEQRQNSNRSIVKEDIDGNKLYNLILIDTSMGSNMGNPIFNPINNKEPKPNHKTLAENQTLDNIINILDEKRVLSYTRDKKIVEMSNLEVGKSVNCIPYGSNNIFYKVIRVN
jgi:hypothetical protein